MSINLFRCPHCGYYLAPKKPIKTKQIECRKCNKPLNVTSKLLSRSWGNFLTLCLYVMSVSTYLIYHLLFYGSRRTFTLPLLMMTLIFAFVFSLISGQVLGLIVGRIEAKKLDLD